MATTQVHVKTVTEVTKSTGMFTIRSISDRKGDGSTTPSILKSEVLREVKIIDTVDGKEGELMISYDSERVGKLDKNVELILDVSNDDTQRYSRGGDDDAYLIYTE